MCGIIAYVGHQCAYPILIKGLKRLEYRGYDSAGVALLDEQGNLSVFKEKGKVAQLEQMVESQAGTGKTPEGTCGIAHTRWATHGVPNKINAHPHQSYSGRFVLIHNGIIENYAQLKAELLAGHSAAAEASGIRFLSETDTEVIVQLIDFYVTEKKLDTLTAFRNVLKMLNGSYAIVLIDKEQPNVLYAARKSSPMVLGIRKQANRPAEYFVASDASPIVEYTKEVMYLNDEELLVLDVNEGIRFMNVEGEVLKPRFTQLQMGVDELEKGGYPFFMLKEIFQQPQALRDCLRGKIAAGSDEIHLPGLDEHFDRLMQAKRVLILACGTSWNAALIGEHVIERYCRIPVEVEYASEFRYRYPVIHPDDFVIALSQSGETADTLAAVELAKSSGAFVYALCNVLGSSLARQSHACTYLNVGPELGVASTKAFSAQVALLVLLGWRLADAKGLLSSQELSSMIEEMLQIPEKVQEILAAEERISQLAVRFTYARNFIYLGRGYNFPVALEGALKLKEISYVHADAYAAAEMKHGPIALIDEEMPVLVIATQSEIYEKMVSNIQEVKARKACVLALVTDGDSLIPSLADFCLPIPAARECLCPILATVPLQLLAYHVAVAKGRNVDQPRNLAKSVTVE